MALAGHVGRAVLLRIVGWKLRNERCLRTERGFGHSECMRGADDNLFDDVVIDDTDGEREVQAALRALAEQQARGSGPTRDQLVSAVRALRES